MDMDKIHDGGNFGLSATLLWSFSDGLPYFWPMLFPFVFVGQINRRSFVEYLKISTAGAAAQQAQQAQQGQGGRQASSAGRRFFRIQCSSDGKLSGIESSSDTLIAVMLVLQICRHGRQGDPQEFQ